MSNHPNESADTLRAALRADLIEAIKARQPELVSARRTAIAAIDNAEAINSPGHPAPGASAHIAGAGSGLGSTEADRRALSVDELRSVVATQISEYVAEAERYERLGMAEPAQRLRRQADALRTYLG